MLSPLLSENLEQWKKQSATYKKREKNPKNWKQKAGPPFLNYVLELWPSPF